MRYFKMATEDGYKTVAKLNRAAIKMGIPLPQVNMTAVGDEIEISFPDHTAQTAFAEALLWLGIEHTESPTKTLFTEFSRLLD